MPSTVRYFEQTGHVQPMHQATDTTPSAQPMQQQPTTQHLHLSAHDLKRHLSDEPFLDWLDLHGVRWLQRQSTERLVGACRA